MAETKVLIVVNDAEAAKAYTQALVEIGAAYDIAPSFSKMAELATLTAYNGLVIDLLTLVRCSKEEKSIAYECINLYPVLRIKWDRKQKRINLSPLEQAFSPDAASVLRFFIEQRCGSFTARQLRRQKRRQLNLSVLVSTEEGCSPESTTRSFTVNMSVAGVFLHTMQQFAENQRLWLRFPELNDQTPIPVTVRWRIEWGVSRSIPGVGVDFRRLTDSQQKELEAILSS